jgi:predicted transcriptional regulator
MTTTTIRVTETTRRQVAALAHVHGLSQSAYLEQLIADQAAAQWEDDFWSRMGGEYDREDRAALAEQEVAYDADFGTET